MAEIHKLPTVSAQHTAIAALKLGFSVTCATCEHLKFAWDTDAENCGKTITCGGPVFGRGFPDYKGPLSTQAFEKLCLVCGDENADYLVLGALRRFGLCSRHHTAFDNIKAPGTQRPMVIRVPGRLM
jgi:hypothetical protein